VKTGTSKDMRDNWCVGFTDRYTVGVWVGNASGEPMHDVSGVSGAAPVWHALVQHLHRGSAFAAPQAPAGVRRAARWCLPARVSRRARGLHRRHRAGAAPARAQRGLRQGISSPADGAVFALDPDMPPAVQRIAFEGERGTWVLDGKAAGAGRTLTWAPWPGRHELQLLTADGRTLHAWKGSSHVPIACEDLRGAQPRCRLCTDRGRAALVTPVARARWPVGHRRHRGPPRSAQLRGIRVPVSA
jgi:penicillin-binding protein 1C